MDSSGSFFRKVLIVDDSKTIVEVLTTTLATLGVQRENVHSARTAHDALAMFDAEGPELVFMDIQLPDQGGDKTALRMLDQKPLTRIIVMTGLDRTDRRVRKLVSAGAYDVLEKPLTVDRIRAVLDRLSEETGGLHRVK